MWKKTVVHNIRTQCLRLEFYEQDKKNEQLIEKKMI